jgi:hypothetical protein
MKGFLSQVLPQSLTGPPPQPKNFIRLGKYFVAPGTAKPALHQRQEYRFVPQFAILFPLKFSFMFFGGYLSATRAAYLLLPVDYCHLKPVFQFDLRCYLQLWQSKRHYDTIILHPSRPPCFSFILIKG